MRFALAVAALSPERAANPCRGRCYNSASEKSAGWSPIYVDRARGGDPR